MTASRALGVFDHVDGGLWGNAYPECLTQRRLDPARQKKLSEDTERLANLKDGSGDPEYIQKRRPRTSCQSPASRFHHLVPSEPLNPSLARGMAFIGRNRLRSSSRLRHGLGGGGVPRGD